MTLDSATPNCPEPLCQWLVEACRAGASDLHVVAGYPPVLRIHGALQPLGADALDAHAVWEMLVAAEPRHAAERFPIERNVDFALELPMEDARSVSAPTTS